MILLILLKGTVRIFVCYNIVIFKLQNHTDLCSEFGTFIAILLGIILAPEDSRTATLSTDNSGMWQVT